MTDCYQLFKTGFSIRRAKAQAEAQAEAAKAGFH